MTFLKIEKIQWNQKLVLWKDFNRGKEEREKGREGEGEGKKKGEEKRNL